MIPTDDQLLGLLNRYFSKGNGYYAADAIRDIRALFAQPERTEIQEAIEDARRLLGCDKSHRSLRDAILRLQDDLTKARAGHSEPKADAPRMSARLAIASRFVAEWVAMNSSVPITPKDWKAALDLADMGIAADRETSKPEWRPEFAARTSRLIEAAKAWHEWRAGYGGLKVHATESDLFDAVEALDR